MARPTVLVATLDPLMACALRKRLWPLCQKLNLKLEVCPQAEGESVLGEKAYASAADFFDMLEACDQATLADTLVVLDVGIHLQQAFAPKSAIGHWRKDAISCGVAVELLLRFPQVFPVFISPGVPTDEGDVNDIPSPRCPDTSQHAWHQFHELRNELASRESPKDWPSGLKDLPALQVPLHFVVPLDACRGLESVVCRFARGMRCWFDPTGLRTLVRNRYLGSVFGRTHDWTNTWPRDAGEMTLRKTLLQRLNKVAAAVDEEREFTVLNAYSAYKYGWRAWLVMSFDELKKAPLWNAEGDWALLVLRDIDLRFPDYPDKQEQSSRKDLRSCTEGIWSRLLKNWPTIRIRAISSEAAVRPEPAKSFWLPNREHEWPPEAVRRGEFSATEARREYIGLSKPLSSLYDIEDVLGRWPRLPLVPWMHKQRRRMWQYILDLCSTLPDWWGHTLPTVVAQLGVTGSFETSSTDAAGHGAPYTNLAVAESLLRQSKRCADGPVSHLLGALLAHEAYCLLLGMSKTTALEALIQMHSCEVSAEVAFPGIAELVNAEPRKRDVEQTLANLFGDETRARADNNRVQHIFLSQFWAELRGIYRDGERFEAAEYANRKGLLCSFRSRSGFLAWRKSVPDCAMRYLIWTGTTLKGWLISGSVLLLAASTAYFSLGLSDCGKPVSFGFTLRETMLASLGLQLTDHLAQAAASGVWGGVLTTLHIGLSYVLFGLLISMLYRKLTRA